MHIPSFAQINAFIAVAEHKSFAKAAGALNIAPSTLSPIISGLERDLGAQLFNRTTRSVSITELGEDLLKRIQPAIHDYLQAIQSVNELRNKPIGKVRLSVPRTAVNSTIRPMVTEFLQTYPDISLEITSGSSDINIVSGNFDVGVRVGDRVEVDMIAIQISKKTQGTIVGSPAYFKNHPPPASPHDLSKHNCIRFRQTSGQFMPWRIEQKGKKLEPLVSGSLIVNDTLLGIQAAVDGVGLLYLARDHLSEYIEREQLVAVLDDYVGNFGGHYICYPVSRHRSAAVRSFITFVRQYCKRSDIQRNSLSKT
jgi:DNA-binding transcriptional LysR family regulator